MAKKLCSICRKRERSNKCSVMICDTQPNDGHCEDVCEQCYADILEAQRPNRVTEEDSQ